MLSFIVNNQEAIVEGNAEFEFENFLLATSKMPSGTSSMPFSFPFCRENNVIFSYAKEDNSILPLEAFSCEIYLYDLLLFTGELYLVEITEKAYKADFTVSSFFVFADKKITSFDLGSTTVPQAKNNNEHLENFAKFFNTTNKNFNEESMFYFPVHYNKKHQEKYKFFELGDQHLVNVTYQAYDVEELPATGKEKHIRDILPVSPFLNFKKLLELIFEKGGWNVNFSDKVTSLIKELVMPSLVDLFRKRKKGLNKFIGRYISSQEEGEPKAYKLVGNYDSTYNTEENNKYYYKFHLSQICINTIDENIGESGSLSEEEGDGVVYTVGKTSWYSIRVKVDFYDMKGGGNDIDLKVRKVKKDGTMVYVGTASHYLNLNSQYEKAELTLEKKLQFEEGEKIKIEIKYYKIESRPDENGRTEFYNNNEALISAAQIVIETTDYRFKNLYPTEIIYNKIVPDITVSDILKVLRNTFNFSFYSSLEKNKQLQLLSVDEILETQFFEISENTNAYFTTEKIDGKEKDISFEFKKYKDKGSKDELIKKKEDVEKYIDLGTPIDEYLLCKTKDTNNKYISDWDSKKSDYYWKFYSADFKKYSLKKEEDLEKENNKKDVKIQSTLELPLMIDKKLPPRNFTNDTFNFSANPENDYEISNTVVIPTLDIESFSPDIGQVTPSKKIHLYCKSNNLDNFSNTTEETLASTGGLIKLTNLHAASYKNENLELNWDGENGLFNKFWKNTAPLYLGRKRKIIIPSCDIKLLTDLLHLFDVQDKPMPLQKRKLRFRQNNFLPTKINFSLGKVIAVELEVIEI